jgi:hypothetical protein
MRSRRPTVHRPLVALVLAASLVASAAVAAQATLSTAAHAHGHQHRSGDGPVSGTVQRDLAKVRAAVARYHTPERATAAGWQLLPGLDHCFEHPDDGGMGVHFIDPEQLGNGTLDPRRPEALVFVPGPRGQLRLGAVEYIVPIADPDDPGEPPSVLGHDLHRLEPVPGVHVWGLHVWLFAQNPTGMFADFNPRVSCDGMVEAAGTG